MVKILKWKLNILARMYLRKYKPMIIGVTGNAGKTSTKEMIGAVAGKKYAVRVSGGNLNNEIGLPLSIIGNFDSEYYEKGPSLFFWLKVLILGSWRLAIGSRYPKALVLEYGADQPGDIKKLVSKYKPNISVVTTVGDVPVHIEFFRDAEAVADEKSNLVSCLNSDDYAILNHDDFRVLGMQNKTKAKSITYGFDSSADIRASDIEYLTDENGTPWGVTFKINEHHHFAPVKINGSLGRSQASSAAAAAAVGQALGLNLVEISEALHHYHGPRGRLKILKGIKNSNIIDDTYNASPASTILALETLRDLPALRKIAILGDMLELGEYTESAHKEIGRFAVGIADVLICVGARAKFIAEAAREGFEKEILIFNTSDEAKQKIQGIIKEHDLILIKGSQGVRMEKILPEIMAEPQKAKKLLVRQSKRWLAK